MTELPLPGPSAGRWDEAGSYLSVSALVLFIISAILAGPTGWPPAVNAVLAALFIALIFAGIAMRFLGLGKFRAEARAGYSTLQDLAGFDLRDATTGRIIRPASEPVAEWSKVSWFRTARRFDRYKLSK